MLIAAGIAIDESTKFFDVTRRCPSALVHSQEKKRALTLT
jgi:hypothetical protein